MAFQEKLSMGLVTKPEEGRMSMASEKNIRSFWKKANIRTGQKKQDPHGWIIYGSKATKKARPVCLGLRWIQS